MAQQREIAKLNDEQEAEAHARRDEADSQREAILLEKEKLKLQRETLKAENAKQKAGKRAERQVAQFRSRWLAYGISLVSGYLPPEEMQRVREALISEVPQHEPFEEPAMREIVSQKILDTLTRDADKITFLFVKASRGC